MKTCDKKRGFTLIEMLITVAVIVILVSLIIGITKRIDDQNKERLCRNELALLDNALEQFRDFGYDYQGLYAGLGLTFPLDCSGFNASVGASSINSTLDNAFGITTTITPATDPPHDPCYSGSEVLYFCLNQIPDCRTTLDKIDKSLVVSDINGTPLTITVTGAIPQTFPLRRFIDPWKMTLRYDYYDVDTSLLPITGTKKTFPVVTSAGPDKQFGTNDDIVNKGK
jgi:prepilin-type N-terminal cleavage/methylation domain-containing protein